MRREGRDHYLGKFELRKALVSQDNESQHLTSGTVRHVTTSALPAGLKHIPEGLLRPEGLSTVGTRAM